MLKSTVQDDLKAAMKAGNTAERDALRLLLAEIKNEEIQLGGELNETQAGQVVSRMVKKTRGSIEEYRGLGQAETVAKLEGELGIYQRYAPAQMSEEQVRAIVEGAVAQAGAAGPQDMGKVMKLVMPQLQGQADGAMVNRLVKDALAKKG
jgi:hypothetical protein